MQVANYSKLNRMKTRLFCLLICIYMLFLVRADEIGRFTVQLEAMHKIYRLPFPSTNSSIIPIWAIALFEITGSGRVVCTQPGQAGYNPRIWFIPAHLINCSALCLYQGDQTNVSAATLTIEKDEKDLIINRGKSPVLKYRYVKRIHGKMKPAFKRSDLFTRYGRQAVNIDLNSTAITITIMESGHQDITRVEAGRWVLEPCFW